MGAKKVNSKGLNKELTEYKIAELQTGVCALQSKIESMDKKNDVGFKSMGGKLDTIHTFIEGYKKDREARDKEQAMQDKRIDRIEYYGFGGIISFAVAAVLLVWNIVKGKLQLP